MEENREQILMDFQSCTGIDDVAESIMHLEASNWELLDAVNNVMPQESQALPSEQESIRPCSNVQDNNVLLTQNTENQLGSTGSSGDVEMIDLSDRNLFSVRVQEQSLEIPPEPNPGGESAQILKLIVKYKDKNTRIEVPASESVATVKMALFTELGIVPCKQHLIGWPRNHVTDNTVLSSLDLPNDFVLRLFTLDDQGAVLSNSSSDPNISDTFNETFKFYIVDQTNNKNYTLSFVGSKTILEIKQDVFALTNIPVRHQKWSGWPEGVKDSTTLVAADLIHPVHTLYLQKVVKCQKKNIKHLSSSESSGDEFEDANECFTVDDDIFKDVCPTNKPKPLISEGVEDEREAVENFIHQFRQRYGDCLPHFFQGTLAEALQASCLTSARDRRPLAVYLHHDESVLSNVFCTQLLCTEATVSYLTQNFVTWAWDLTFNSNRSQFLAAVTQELGAAAAGAIRDITTDHLPALVVITRLRSSTEVLTVIPGTVGLDEFMTNLIHAYEMFCSQVGGEIQEEREREARETVKREQDAAYHASLMADRAKEEARKLEEAERQQKLLLEEQEREKQDEIRRQEESVKEAIRQSLAEQLPPEPDESCSDISKIRFRLPTGELLYRRFRCSECLHVLVNYLASVGYPVEDYKVLTSWPRRDLTTLDLEKTLYELKLYPQETITLEEK